VILRRLPRAVALASVLTLIFLRLRLMRLQGPLTPERRAQWIQRSARDFLAVLGIGWKTEGKPPASGLLVSNHLSYLDILSLAATVPCCFVSKIEVASWPIFGSLARGGATIFLDRASGASARLAAEQMAQRLQCPVPVLLFPEGTSTDGSHVLRFHARLFQPAIQTRAPITAAAIRYRSEEGGEERELCWYANAPFLPHLWKVLGLRGFSACIHFGEPRLYADARSAARETQAAVERARRESGGGDRAPQASGNRVLMSQ
jgi:lyso-ornithine lipid O-acyltransferase